MRFLLECTYVYEHPVVNSGIQRVVRNIVKNLEGSWQDHEVIPVMFNQCRIYRVHQLIPLPPKTPTISFFTNIRAKFPVWQHLFAHWGHHYWLACGKLHQTWPFKKSHNLRRLLFVTTKLAAVWYKLPVVFFRFLGKNWVDSGRAEPFEVRSDDVLVLLDSSWHSDFFPLVEVYKQRGLSVVSVIYDLIPLTHPQFCDENLVVVFKGWFKWAIKHADGFMCISKTVMLDTQSAVADRLGSYANRQRYGYFYLGSDLDLIKSKGSVRGKVASAFDEEAPTYLIVSTIEPRKNHVYLLDAFELLWAQGVQVRLCIVGQIGWKCDDLIARIRKHPEFGRRLRMLNDVGDKELEYCYQHAEYLVFPSYVEGFGLPLIEAMARGLPVMASDIPVFREIGTDYVDYFDLADPGSLASLISGVTAADTAHKRDLLRNWSWLSWEMAADQFMERIVAHVEEVRAQTVEGEVENSH